MGRHGDYLYRRNGRFYARLRVPATLRTIYGNSDLRVSLDTPDYAEARLRVLEKVLAWKRDFHRAHLMLNPQRLVNGSPLLLGEGLISLGSAGAECGLSVDTLLSEAIERRFDLRIRAIRWIAIEVAANTLEYDLDGTVIINTILDKNHPIPITDDLFLHRDTLKMIKDGELHEGLFFRDAQRTRAIVVDLPGVSVPVASLLIDKRDAEALRVDLAGKVSPALLIPAAAAAAATTVAPTHKHGMLRVSELLSMFYDGKKEVWGLATKNQMTGMCGRFVDLMGNPTLGEIDGDTMRQYLQRLQTLPGDLYQNGRKYGHSTAELLTAVANHNLPTMSADRARAYVEKMKEAFGWAVRNGYMPTNPAGGTLERKNKARRDQDVRDPFTDENLRAIFSVNWFRTGSGKLNRHGGFHDWQAVYYWLPLLGLYTGARLNELSQLYLKDICCTEAGTWYIDFNLIGIGKIDEPDKRLKNVNSVRKIPLHPELVRLGLVDYLTALKAAGYERLFPELKHDAVKGFGKASGSWFNERFLGLKLKIVRDNTQTFHSFRHGFTTAVSRLSPRLDTPTINQLTGHKRGDSEAENRYRKDELPDELSKYVEQLSFGIPVIAPFDIQAGLRAVQDALGRKEVAAATTARAKRLKRI